jgi:hypothetical protein
MPIAIDFEPMAECVTNTNQGYQKGYFKHEHAQIVVWGG